MELVWGATLWSLWACWLLAQHLRAPAAITRVSAGLLVAELVTLVVHGYACDDQGCGVAGSLAGTAASIDLPALAGVFVSIVVAREWLRAHRADPDARPHHATCGACHLARGTEPGEHGRMVPTRSRAHRTGRARNTLVDVYVAAWLARRFVRMARDGHRRRPRSHR